MRHAVWLAVALCGCEKKQGQPPVPAPVVAMTDEAAPPDDASPDDATSENATAAPHANRAPALIDLGRSVPMTVRLSSQVRNPKILPKHIVDRDFGTAWNSLTGELEGSWIEVELPGSTAATIEELRMTIGSTGRGPKNEDYFTMNPRIAKVAIRADGGAATTVALDPTRRDLQTITVRAKKTVRIEIVELVPGTKKNWREVSVSELEAWGSPGPGFTPPSSPRTPHVIVAPQLAGTPCADIEERRAEFQKNDKRDDPNCTHGCDDKNYPPDCEVLALPTTTLGPPWTTGIGECDINDEIYGPKVCTLTFRQGAVRARISVESSAAKADVTLTEMLQQDVIAGGLPELVVRLDVDDTSYIAVCRAKPLGCTDAIAIAEDGWKTQPRFEDGKLVLDRVSGTPPTNVLGPRALTFD